MNMLVLGILLVLVACIGYLFLLPDLLEERDT